MKLSNSAKEELKTVLRNDIGEVVDTWSDEELNQCGDFVLTVVAESLKIKAQKRHG